eukprot:2473880-Rhodomonas_salina.2
MQYRMIGGTSLPRYFPPQPPMMTVRKQLNVLATFAASVRQDHVRMREVEQGTRAVNKFKRFQALETTYPGRNAVVGTKCRPKPRPHQELQQNPGEQRRRKKEEGECEECGLEYIMIHGYFFSNV